MNPFSISLTSLLALDTITARLQTMVWPWRLLRHNKLVTRTISWHVCSRVTYLNSVATTIAQSPDMEQVLSVLPIPTGTFYSPCSPTPYPGDHSTHCPYRRHHSTRRLYQRDKFTLSPCPRDRSVAWPYPRDIFPRPPDYSIHLPYPGDHSTHRPSVYPRDHFTYSS
jgi:hypothetical protein